MAASEPQVGSLKMRVPQKNDHRPDPDDLEAPRRRKVIITPDGGDDDVNPENPRYEYREIGIVTDDVPKDCFRNVITTFGHYLYLVSESESHRLYLYN